MIVFAFNQIFANALIASDNQKVNLQANIIGMVGNICLNLLLIPQFGFMGAGIANVASTLMVLVFQYSFISKYLFKINFIRHAKRPVISAVLMGSAVLFFREINMFLLITFSVTFYFVCILALKTFSARDIDLLRKLFKGDDLVVTQNKVD